MPPGGLALVLSFSFSALLCIAIVGRSLSLPRTVVAVSVTQFMLHLLYSVRSGQGSSAVTSGHQHDTIVLSSGANAGSPFADDASMLLAHLSAIAVTVLALRHGDRSLRAAARTARLTVASVLPRLPRLERPTPASRPIAVIRDVRPRRALLLFSTLRHRGPPAGFAAA